jgi:hypothetical protein
MLRDSGKFYIVKSIGLVHYFFKTAAIVLPISAGLAQT